MQSFEHSWEDIVEFAESEQYVKTIFHGNKNEIRVVEGAIEVKNLNTQTTRTIERAEFRFAHQRLDDRGQLMLEDIEPELAGKKSMVLAILAAALNLETDKRPVTVYTGAEE